MHRQHTDDALIPFQFGWRKILLSLPISFDKSGARQLETTWNLSEEMTCGASSSLIRSALASISRSLNSKTNNNVPFSARILIKRHKCRLTPRNWSVSWMQSTSGVPASPLIDNLLLSLKLYCKVGQVTKTAICNILDLWSKSSRSGLGGLTLACS